MSGRRIAVVLFNLGGPDDAASVRPFLFNLFRDPAIIGLPDPLRTWLAGRIAGRREASAQANYGRMDHGGGSPLLGATLGQAEALRSSLADRMPSDEVRVFVAMRYWRPLTEQAAAEVADFGPDEVVLLPLYPQFSTTTTQSSLKAWDRVYAGGGRQTTVCCWPALGGWIEVQAELIRSTIAQAGDQPIRVLFSAHGIPENRVRRGDPYQEQVETTVAAVVDRLGGVDHEVCYQSRVGPLKWLGPATPDAIRQAAADGVGVVVVPIAFVSEHIETLVELDIDYGELAHGLGVEPYLRTPTVDARKPFIEGLAGAVTAALCGDRVGPAGPGCRASWRACPRQAWLRSAA